MKSFRIVLTFLVVIAAVGGAFASSRFFATDGYKFVSTNPVGSKCVFVVSCAGGSTACTFNGSPQLYQKDSQDHCSTTALTMAP
jgi:hypothetical protein